MKAIYINLDPYLAAFAAWHKGGKSGDTPKFSPLPLAVTIPLGESVAAYMVADASDPDTVSEAQTITADGQTIYVGTAGYDEATPEAAIAFQQVPALSALAPSLKYLVLPVTGESLSFAVTMIDADDNLIRIPFTVLVRRETASGPVDLVDFTPPAAAPTAAQINAALGGTGAQEGAPLAGVDFDYALYRGDGIVAGEIDGKNVLCVGGS